ncbi:hypothetical protein [Nostoc sp.]|uniref:hypothetical protein n=1 Tax=Nostoc sp. TaxID=1180 RepID=UPI002FFC0FE8
MPYSNAPEILTVRRLATTHPTLKFLNIDGNISTDLLMSENECRDVEISVYTRVYSKE